MSSPRQERIIDPSTAALAAAIFFNALVTGFLLAFAIVVMPGIRRLDDRTMLESFRAIDGVIQNRQPLFILLWVGAALSLLLAVVISFASEELGPPIVLVGALLVQLLGVQLPTFLINIPLNNRVQALDLEGLTAAELHAERSTFETRWNRSNALRTALSGLITVALLTLLAT